MNQQDTKNNHRIHQLQEWLIMLFQDGILSQEELQKFQESLFDVIAKIAQTSLGGMMELQQEKAVQLMESVQYQIAYQLNQCRGREQQIELIKTVHPGRLFQSGHELLIEHARAGETCAKRLEETMRSFGNQAYDMTVSKGLPDFFEEYDVVFKAHEMPGEFDYPLCIPVENRTGYDYVKEYMEHFCAEEELLCLFSEEQLKSLLQGYSRDYPYLAVNLYELVLANIITYLLMGESKEQILKLTMKSEMVDSMKHYLLENGWIQLRTRGMECMAELPEKINQRLSTKGKEYLMQAAEKVLYRCQNSARTDTLHQILVVPKLYCEPQKPSYDTEVKLSKEELNQVIVDLEECVDTRDKIAKLRKRVHNMEDLILVLSTRIYGEEARELFIQLSNLELAKLMLYVLDASAAGDSCCYEEADNWHMELLLTIQSMDVVRQQEINQLITKMKNK